MFSEALDFYSMYNDDYTGSLLRHSSPTQTHTYTITLFTHIAKSLS